MQSETIGDVLPPPPPPPPPSPSGRAWLPWAIGVGILVVAGIVLAVVLTVGGEDTAGPTLSTEAPASSEPGETTTAPATTAVTTTLPTTTTTAPITTTTASTTTRPRLLYSPEELAYFVEIAGQPEYGVDNGEVHRWVEDLRLAVYGDPSPRDLTVLGNVIDDLNEIIAPLALQLVDDEPNVEIYFLPQDQFPAIEPNYVAGNFGFFWTWWDDEGAIYRARILYSTPALTPEERAHMIREELTQVLGLMNDSPEYPDSIFQIEWTTTNRYTPIDRALIEMLYRPEVVPGMSITEAVDLLAQMTR